MSFNARSLAKLGIGFPGRASATLGFTSSLIVIPLEISEPANASGGGSSFDAGVGYFLEDNKWVKATKWAKTSGTALSGRVTVYQQWLASLSSGGGAGYRASVESRAELDGRIFYGSVTNFNAEVVASSRQESMKMEPMCGQAKESRLCRASIDEILVLLDT